MNIVRLAFSFKRSICLTSFLNGFLASLELMSRWEVHSPSREIWLMQSQKWTTKQTVFSLCFIPFTVDELNKLACLQCMGLHSSAGRAHCTANAEATGSNPVAKNFFRATSQLLSNRDGHIFISKVLMASLVGACKESVQNSGNRDGTFVHDRPGDSLLFLTSKAAFLRWTCLHQNTERSVVCHEKYSQHNLVWLR